MILLLFYKIFSRFFCILIIASAQFFNPTSYGLSGRVNWGDKKWPHTKFVLSTSAKCTVSTLLDPAAMKIATGSYEDCSWQLSLSKKIKEREKIWATPFLAP